MNRRDFLGIAAASIFAPKFGQWYRQGSGLIVREIEPQWKPVGAAGYYTEQFWITGVSPTTITVERFPKPVRVPVGGSVRLRSRALFSDAMTGRPRPTPPKITTHDAGNFRVGQMIRIPEPFAYGQMMILP